MTGSVECQVAETAEDWGARSGQVGIKWLTVNRAIYLYLSTFLSNI